MTERERKGGWVVVSRRRDGRRKDYQRQNAMDWRLGTTFLFRNFPEDCHKEELWDRFSEVGKVEDIFIPRKRDLMGFRFGFVRISKGGDVGDILQRLNRIWIGTYVIRAFVPKHGRHVGKMGGNERRAFDPDMSEHGVSIASQRREGVGYAEVLKGKQGQGSGAKEEAGWRNKGFEFQSTKEEKEWLEGAVTGLLKESFLWKEHEDEIRSECAGCLNIINIGENRILITSQRDEETETTLKGLEEWTSFWLSWWRPWCKTDVNQRRESWTRWIGVPLQAWTRRFFVQGCESFGKLLEIHVTTSAKKRMDEAYVKVETGLESIDRVMEC